MRQTVNWLMEISLIDHDFENWNAMKYWSAETLYSRTRLATANHRRPLRFFSRARGSCTQAIEVKEKKFKCALAMAHTINNYLRHDVYRPINA